MPYSKKRNRKLGENEKKTLSSLRRDSNKRHWKLRKLKKALYINLTIKCLS